MHMNCNVSKMLLARC